MTDRCQYKIRWTFDTDAQCELDHHIDSVVISERADKQFDIITIGDGLADTDVHRTHVGPNKMSLSWHAGDRREFTGDWPGPCTKLGDVAAPHPCTLHTGHHGRCAP